MTGSVQSNPQRAVHRIAECAAHEPDTGLADGLYPLSDEQAARLARDELAAATGRPPYRHHAPLVARLRGRLDRGRLHAAMARVYGDHEALRIRCLRTPSGWRQVVTDQPWVENVVDACGKDDAEIEEIVRSATHDGFEVEGGPLFRSTLVVRSPEEHVLVLTAEHLVCDGWSIGIVLREVGAAYAQPDRPERADDVTQFPSFAQWQRERLQGQFLADLVAFWRRRLGGASAAPVYAFPFGREAHSSQLRSAGATVGRRLPDRLERAVEQVATTAGVTTFEVFSSALHALLHRYTNAAIVVIPTPVSGRRFHVRDGSVGWFATRLPLVASLDAGTTSTDLLTQAQEARQELSWCEQLPFARLVEELEPVAGRRARYDGSVTLNYIPERMEMGFGGVSFGDLEAVPSSPRLSGARSTLAFALSDRGGSFGVTLRYDTAELDIGHAEAVLDDYLRAIAWISVDRELPVGELDVRAGSE